MCPPSPGRLQPPLPTALSISISSLSHRIFNPCTQPIRLFCALLRVPARYRYCGSPRVIVIAGPRALSLLRVLARYRYCGSPRVIVIAGPRALRRTRQRHRRHCIPCAHRFIYLIFQFLGGERPQPAPSSRQPCPARRTERHRRRCIPCMHTHSFILHGFSRRADSFACFFSCCST